MKQYVKIFGLILIASITQFATDIYLPSIPAISKFFHSTINMSQLTIAVYMIALTVTQLFWGPLSDQVGRKKALITGLMIGLVGSILCASAQSIDVLILGRSLQGVGFGAAAGLWRAILRDLYSGEELASVASYFGNLLILTLMMAPLLGGFLQEYSNWRTSFLFLLALTLLCLTVLWFFIPETKQKDITHPTANWINAYGRLLRSRLFMGCCLSNFLTYGGMFAWITSSSAILVKQGGLTPVQFGFWVAIVGTGILIGSTLNGYFVKKMGIQHMLTIGWSIIVITGLCLSLGSMIQDLSTTLVICSAFSFYVGSSFIFSNTNATAFAPFGDIAGTASGLYAFIQLAGGAVTSLLLSLIQETSFLLGLFFFVTGLAAWISFIILVKPTTTQR